MTGYRTSPQLDQAAEFARLTSLLAHEVSKPDATAMLVRFALVAVPGAESSGLTIRTGESAGRSGPGGDLGYRTLAATDEFPAEVDSIQYALHQGPCLSALQLQRMVHTNDLGSDTRWPRFAPRAVAETGVSSMLSQNLFVEDGHTFGALNLYSRKAEAFDEDAATVLNIFATLAGIAIGRVADREEVHHLRRALDSNRKIGTAMGVLMSQYKLTDQQAFDLMRMASQRSHRKLAAVALDVIDTGTLELP